MNMDPNDLAVIREFVKRFETISGIIRDINPDCIIAPMFGAVPFIDVLNIVDGNFPNDKVEYIPASSKLYGLRDVLRGCFENLIKEHTPDGGTFLSLDEVVSGNSLQRVYKQFDAATTAYANKKTLELYTNADFRDKRVKAYRDRIRQSIIYNSIGVVDSKLTRGNKQKNSAYEDLVKRKIVIPVDVPCIVTMDRTDFFPAEYKTATDSEGKTIFLPVVDNFNITSAYIDFLKMVASIVGKDPAAVTVSNIGKIRDSYMWVPENLRTN